MPNMYHNRQVSNKVLPGKVWEKGPGSAEPKGMKQKPGFPMKNFMKGGPSRSAGVAWVKQYPQMGGMG